MRSGNWSLAASPEAAFFLEAGLRSISVRAYAKVNLGLAVRGKRDDGFHEIETIFQSVSLADTVRIREASGPEPVTLNSIGPSVPVDGTNLAWRAAEAMQERYGAPPVALEIEKRIPVAAGLGGGSADAAAVLAGIDRLFEADAGPEELRELALGLGSDVPFMLEGGTVMATGRGERMERLPALTGLALVLATPPFGVSAADAYRRVRIGLTDPVSFIRVNCSAIREGDIPSLLAGLRNDLEAGVVSACPEVAAVKTALLEGGARAAMMSGSGPTVFGVADNVPEGESIASRLTGRGWSIHVVEPIDCGLKLEDQESAP